MKEKKKAYTKHIQRSQIKTRLTYGPRVVERLIKTPPPCPTNLPHLSPQCGLWKYLIPRDCCTPNPESSWHKKYSWWSMSEQNDVVVGTFRLWLDPGKHTACIFYLQALNLTSEIRLVLLYLLALLLRFFLMCTFFRYIRRG